MNRSLLVVDDDVDQLMVLTHWFIQRGYRPVSVTHPRQALEAARIQQFRVALVDASLPEMDGLELMRRLIQIQEDVKVIVLSGYEYPQHRAKADGAFAWLVKSCRLSLVEASVQRAFDADVDDSPAQKRPAVSDKCVVVT